eukprot:11125316-Alexandrium_andersonii.AAC.1
MSEICGKSPSTSWGEAASINVHNAEHDLTRWLRGVLRDAVHAYGIVLDLDFARPQMRAQRAVRQPAAR